MEVRNLLYDWPDTSFLTSICRFLTVKEVAMLDTATTMHAYRRKLLASLEETPCRLSQFEQVISLAMLLYLLRRKIWVCNLRFGVSKENYVNKKSISCEDGYNKHDIVTEDRSLWDTSAEAFHDFVEFPRFHSVDLRGCSRETVSILVRAIVIKCPNLKMLSCDVILDEELVLVARHCHKVEILNLGNCGYIDKSVEIICKFHMLRELDLRNSSGSLTDVSYSIYTYGSYHIFF